MRITAALWPPSTPAGTRSAVTLIAAAPPNRSRETPRSADASERLRREEGKSDRNACSGKNDCKGKGWIAMSAEDCKAKGGTVK